MQTNIHGVAALAQLNSERQRAEELERAAAEATEKASALQAALDAATEKHGHEVLRAQAAHTEQVQRLEGALEATKAEAEEMRKGVAALESGAHSALRVPGETGCLYLTAVLRATQSWPAALQAARLLLAVGVAVATLPLTKSLP